LFASKARNLRGKGLYVFGDFRLDPDRRLLFRGDERVPLTPKAIELLLVFIEKPGQVRSREELLAAVWRNSHVEESNLTQTVFVLRKTLGQTPDIPFIVTVPGAGYRFTANVARTAQVSEASPPTEKARPWLVWSAAAFGVLLIGAAAVVWSRSLFLPPLPPESAPRTMLAVLPFENLTGDLGQEYLSDGLTEEMIGQIGKLDPRLLGVIARTSVMRYKQSRPPVDRIGQELGVDYLLEGSVRRDATRIRIVAKLAQVSDQTQLWTREYDRELTHVLALERDIAHDLAAEIQLTLDRSAGRIPEPRSFEAHDAYLKGRFFWNKRTSEGFEEAIKYFQRAIELDPKDARAHAGLADCYALLPGYMGVSSAPYVERARAAALRAVELDDGLAEAHTSLALILENYDWNWGAAEREYRRATELNANYATAHHWYAEFLTWNGRFEEALLASEEARRLDPLSLIIAADGALIHYFARQYDLAERKLQAVLELEPGFPRAHVIRNVYVQQGRFDQAIADIMTYSPDTTLWDLAHALGRAGRVEEAERALQRLLEQEARQPVDPGIVAWAYAGMGNVAVALDWLERGYAARSNLMTTLKVDPGWDPLRGDPRFQDLLRRMGW
jgi:TolB-like protein/DNA-binding winged helix-turn-helix (wHTH) protein/Tfp pilus assembly protein PilF